MGGVALGGAARIPLTMVTLPISRDDSIKLKQQIVWHDDAANHSSVFSRAYENPMVSLNKAGY